MVTGPPALVDALIMAVAVALVLWAAFIEPTWTAAAGSSFERFVAVAYPVGDVVLVTQLVHLGSARSSRSPTVVLLGVAVAVILCADLLFQAAAYVPWLEVNITLLDPLWSLFYVLWAAAALHPDMSLTASAEPPAEHPLTARRVAFLSCAVLVLPGLVLVETLAGVPTHTTEVSIAAVVLIVLVIGRMLGLVRRVNEQSAHLARLAATDSLTGLENARSFTERLGAELGADARRRRDGRGPALMLVAVERFTEVNDTLGLRTGEELLRAVGRRLEVEMEVDGVVARMGGESFAVLLPGGTDGERAVERAHDVLRAFEEPFGLSEVTVSVEVAVGVAVAPAAPTTAVELMQRADVALSAARERGERVGRYSERRDAHGALTPVLLTELEPAMEHGQVLLHFQPQVEIASGRVLGVEALVRWDHPQHGLLGPAAFVPAAERAGMIRALTAHVLDQALAQAASWRSAGRDLAVSVNLSVRNLLDPGFVDEVRAALERHDMPASALELEITETMAMVDPTRSVEVLGALDALGVLLSVDDYGTGYSSLAYLQRLPVRRLKIDRSFVAGVVEDPASAAIVRSTVELARHLGLDVVAEGVEDDAVLLALREMRCFAAQGFGLARPLPALQVPGAVDAIELRVPALVRSVPAPRRPAVV